MKVKRSCDAADLASDVLQLLAIKLLCSEQYIPMLRQVFRLAKMAGHILRLEIIAALLLNLQGWHVLGCSGVSEQHDDGNRSLTIYYDAGMRILLYCTGLGPTTKKGPSS